MDFLRHYFQDDVARESKPKLQELVHGDEKAKTKTKTKTTKKVHFESQPLLQSDIDAEKSSYQVKILMKKEEAVRLLSKCKDGGVVELKDVGDVLIGVPTHRVVSINKKDI